MPGLASGAVSGFLSASDWTTFNNKVATTRLINTSSPLTGGGDLSGDRTISINNALADGSTKGAATFTSLDFNDNGSGLISIDYANGQKATSGQPGFLTSSDWSTFNSKQPAGNYLTGLTGDVTASGPGSVASTISSGAVTYSKIQNVSSSNIVLGRIASGAGIVQELTSANIKSIIGNAAADGSTLGVAAFNSTNFTASSGVINTVQNIATTASPLFSGMTVNSNIFKVWNDSNSITIWGQVYSNQGAQGIYYQADRFRGTHTSPSEVQDGDYIFDLYAQGYDGANRALAGEILGSVNGSPSTGVIPFSWNFKLMNNAGSYISSLYLGSDGNSQFNGSITTGAPSGYFSAPWLLGNYSNYLASVGISGTSKRLLTTESVIENYNNFNSSHMSDSVSTNCLAGKWSRLLITEDGSTINPEYLTDLNYEHYSNYIGTEGDSAHVFLLDLTANGLYPSVDGLVYAKGLIRLCFYAPMAGCMPVSWSARYKTNDDVWHDLAMTLNGESNDTGQVSILEGRIGLYHVKQVEFTLNTGTGSPYVYGTVKWALTQIEYLLDRLSLNQSADITSIGGLMAGDLQWINTNGPVVIDTATGTKYRIKVTSGVLGLTAV